MSLKSTTNLLNSVTPTVLYTCPVGVDASAHGIVFGNLTGTDKTVNLFLYKSSTALNSLIGENLTVKGFDVLSWPRPLNMQAGDYITATCSVDDTVEVTVSIFETRSILTALNFKGVWDSATSYYGNDVVNYNGSSYVALGYSLNGQPDNTSGNWVLWVTAGNFVFSDTPPINAIPGDRWFNSNNGILYTYINDGNTVQWVDTTGRNSLLTIVNVYSNTHEIGLASNGKLLKFASDNPVTVIVPSYDTAPFPVGSQILLLQNGLGKVTLTPTNGVTIQTPETLSIRKQFGQVSLINLDTNIWTVEGNLEFV